MNRYFIGFALVATGAIIAAHSRSNVVLPAARQHCVSVAAEAPNQVRLPAEAWENEDIERRRLIDTSLRECLDGSDPAQIVRVLSPDLLDCTLADEAIQQWALHDRAAAAAWMASIGDPSVAHAGYVMYGWLKEDPEGMHRYLNSLPDGAWRTNTFKAASNDALAAGDGVEAVWLLGKLPPEPQRNEMLGWAATTWARNDPASATEWAAQAGLPGVQDQLLGAVAIGYAWTDPAAAVWWLGQVSVAGLPPAAENITAIWARQDAPGAAAWMVSTSAAQQPEIVQAVVSNWAYQDLPAAEAWVSSLPDGSLKEQCGTNLEDAKSRLTGHEPAPPPTASNL